MKYLENAQKLRNDMDSAGAMLTDDQALTVQAIFPMWTTKDYAAGDRVQYGGTLYKCVQAHTAQANWTPDTTPALWTAVSLDEWPEWVQPSGAHDAYRKGDKVTHNGSRWTSDMDGNTWEPGVYGWTEKEEA